MNPGQILFDGHVSQLEYRFGQEQGMWGVAAPPSGIAWPNVIIWVQTPRHVSTTGRVFLLFDLTGYSEAAPTSFPCSHETGTVLPDAQWPKGNSVIENVFRPGWRRDALYLPCDRQALPGHHDWPQRFPHQLWTRNPVITHYLRIVHQILNPPDA